jgi:hypothetical protein
MASLCYSQNIAVLKRTFPALAEIIEKTNADPASPLAEEAGFKAEPAASGDPTLIYNGLYIHSKINPKREAERLVETEAAKAAGNEDTVVLVLGFGLGYAFSALAEKFPKRPVIIVEKRPEIIKKTLELRDFSPFLARENLVFVLDTESLTAALSLFESTPGAIPLVLRNRALCDLDKEWYELAEGKIASWNQRTNVNQATKKRFGKRWVKNLSLNLQAVRDFPGISRLEGILEKPGIPVFLAAAGPSLDEAAPYLNEIYKRCLIVAVDTSLRFLCDRNTEPDFALSVDPQYWNSRHLDRVLLPKTRLVTESAVYPTLFRLPFGLIFLCGSFFPLGRFVEDRVDPKGDLGAGGSVATSAWDFIRLLGAKKVWISGLDLSFPELKTHFHGALFEEKFHASSGRFAPGETWNYRLLRDGRPFYAKCAGGGAVLTDERLSLYAAWFENRFSQFPVVENLCFSSGGLEIKNLKVEPVEGLLALPERRGEIDRLLKEADGTIRRDFFSKEAVENREKKYKNARGALLNGLKAIKGLALDAEKEAKEASARCKLGHLEKGYLESALKKLDSANTAIKNSDAKDIAGFLLPETTNWEADIAEKTQDPLLRHLEYSSRFYKALSAAAEYNLEILY